MPVVRKAWLYWPHAISSYDQVYDLKTRKIINKEYLKIQQEVRTEFKEMGLEILQS